MTRSFAAPKLTSQTMDGGGRLCRRRQCGVYVDYVTVAVNTLPALLCNINAARRHVITLSRLLCLATLFAGVQIIGARLLFPRSRRFMLSLHVVVVR